ncbi:hypothetical protein [Burkholderia gladioli]|uniref:hypothetical protein n=1 Tax=Burkholderia gladioli TaxID=28095 RepID=UPI00163E9420|nr:hypothetical protein [Burkholderia gladioli]
MTLQQPHHARHDVRQGQTFELAATVPRDAGCSMFPQRIIFAAPHAVIACVRIRLVDGGTNQDRCMNPLFDRFHESIEAQASRKHRSRATVHARVSTRLDDASSDITRHHRYAAGTGHADSRKLALWMKRTADAPARMDSENCRGDTASDTSGESMPRCRLEAAGIGSLHDCGNSGQLATGRRADSNISCFAAVSPP